MNEKIPEVIKETPGKPFICIPVIMALLTLLVPIAASYLDMKDANKASEQELELKPEARKVHSRVLDIQPLFWYWFFIHGADVKSDQLLNAPLKKISFGEMIKLTHPVLNILTQYEGQRKSRFFRIMPWLC
jgi:hypothetical protein